MLTEEETTPPGDPTKAAPGAGEEPELGRTLPRLDFIRDALIRLQSVAEVGHILLEGEQARASYSEALTRACDKTRASIGLLFTYDGASKRLVLVASCGLRALGDAPPPTLGLGQGLSGWVAQNRRPYISNDILADGRFDSRSFLQYSRLSAISVPLLYQETLMGVLTLCSEAVEAFGQADLLTSEAMASSIALALRCHALRSQVHSNYLSIIQALVNALEAKDPATRGHSMRVARMSRDMARVMGLGQGAVDRIEIAARLHDVGKIGVPDRLLNSPSPLSPEEWVLIKLHPRKGAEILGGIPALEPVARIVEAHHERPDGKGYPRGLTGEDIPLESRIVAVADAFDAIIMGRAYRCARGLKEALAEITSCAGSQFDPAAVRALARAMDSKTFGHFYDGFIPRDGRARNTPSKA